jgi:heme A synthase
LISVVLVILTTPPTVIPFESMDGIVVPCSSKMKGVPCPLCGMTTAFYLISAGEFAESHSSNPRAIALYLLLLVNEAVLGAWAVIKTLRRIYRCKY